MLKIALLIVCVLAGCVSNPADRDQKTADAAELYGSKQEGSILSPKAALVTVASVDGEELFLQFDFARPRYVQPGMHTVRLSVAIADMTALPTFDFLALAKKKYRFSARGIDGEFEVLAHDVTLIPEQLLFVARVSRGTHPKVTYTTAPTLK